MHFSVQFWFSSLSFGHICIAVGRALCARRLSSVLIGADQRRLAEISGSAPPARGELYLAIELHKMLDSISHACETSVRNVKEWI